MQTMTGSVRILTFGVFAIMVSGCEGTGSQWLTQTAGPPRTATSGLVMDSPANNAVGLAPHGVVISVTEPPAPPGVAILFGTHLTITLNPANGAPFDLQLANTTTSPVQPYFTGLAPPLASRTYYVITTSKTAAPGLTPQTIGCFTTG